VGSHAAPPRYHLTADCDFRASVLQKSFQKLSATFLPSNFYTRPVSWHGNRHVPCGLAEVESFALRKVEMAHCNKCDWRGDVVAQALKTTKSITQDTTSTNDIHAVSSEIALETHFTLPVLHANDLEMVRHPAFLPALLARRRLPPIEWANQAAGHSIHFFA